MHFFRQPHDLRWRQPLHRGPGLLYYIAGLVAIIWVLVIASVIYTAGYKSTSIYQAPINWKKMYDCDVGQVMILFLGVGIETIHLPVHIVLHEKARMHPIASIVLSVCGLTLWFTTSFFALLVDWCAETSRSTGWEVLCYMRQAIGYVVCLLYFVYLGYAAAATHRWRKERNARLRLKGGSSTRLDDLPPKSSTDSTV